MKKTSLVGHVLEVLHLIRSQSRPADGVVAEFFRNRHYLGSKDRRFIADTIYGILRNFLLLEAYTAAGREAGEPITDKSSGSPLELYVAYARAILKEDPASIVLDTDLPVQEGTSKLNVARFLDAIDRSVQPPPDADPVLRLTLLHSMPKRIVEEWVERFGEGEAGELCAASNLPAPIAIRVNTLRCSMEECQALLLAEGVNTGRTPYSPVGLTLEKRVSVQALRAFREGAFEMQDEGSQILSFLLEPAPGARIVDACAGAGGKTLHIATIMKNQGSILALDVDRKRLDNLRERAHRAGVTTVRLQLAGEPAYADWQRSADAVLVDAPCTGVGTFRRNPGMKRAFSTQLVHTAAERQRSILEEYSRLVRSGGRLVYATCSLLGEENEDVVQGFLKMHPEFQLRPATEILARQGINVPAHPESSFLLLLPHVTNTDGFFGAVLEREEC